MSTGTIKELLADVDVIAGDIRASAVNTAALRDQSVTGAKILSATITLNKLDKEVGVWSGVHFDCTSLSSAKTTAFRTILSSACTVLACILNVTTDDGVDDDLTVEDSAGNNIVTFISPSAAITHMSTNLTALATVQARPIGAGGAVVVTVGTKQKAMIGDLYLLTITTPT